MTATGERDDFEQRVAEVHTAAKSVVESCNDWIELLRRVFGTEGIVRRVFPTSEMLSRFELTEEYADIERLIIDRRNRMVHQHPEMPVTVFNCSSSEEFRSKFLTHWHKHVRQPSAVRLACQVNEFTPTDEVADELANLCRALNAFHIACGGDGLTIDDWEVYVRRSVPVEVP